MVNRPPLLHRAQRHPDLLVLGECPRLARLQPPLRPPPGQWNGEILLAQHLEPDADEEERGEVALDSGTTSDESDERQTTREQ
jgi:hypothetical protein